MKGQQMFFNSNYIFNMPDIGMIISCKDERTGKKYHSKTENIYQPLY